MAGVGFNRAMPLYVASGLLTYMNTSGALSWPSLCCLYVPVVHVHTDVVRACRPCAAHALRVSRQSQGCQASPRRCKHSRRVRKGLASAACMWP